VLGKDGAGRALDAARDALASLDPFSSDAIEAALRELPERIGLKPKTVFQAVRVAVTGSKVSPPLLGALRILGVAETKARLESAIQALTKEVK